ncbi:MAG: hypothetical protein ACREE2_18030, partial [Stellaceae bacterium]
SGHRHRTLRAGHMTAPDHFAKTDLNIFRRRGPSTYELCKGHWLFVGVVHDVEEKHGERGNNAREKSQ